MIEALWLNSKDNNQPKVKESPILYSSLLVITFLNIYFGLDASFIVDSSFNAADMLIGRR